MGLRRYVCGRIIEGDGRLEPGPGHKGPDAQSTHTSVREGELEELPRDIAPVEEEDEVVGGTAPAGDEAA